MATIYANSLATGLNDGSSWDNGYTDLADAIAAMRSGDRLLTNSTRAVPFSYVAITDLQVWQWYGDRGPSAETWIFGGLLSNSWVDAGGGVFSLAGFSAEPYKVSYNHRQDSGGAATGCTYDANKTRAVERLGFTVAECEVWLGMLTKTAGTQTAPGVGEYGYAAGTLYVNPAGSPTLAQIKALTYYSNPAFEHLVYITDSSDFVIRGVKTYWSPVANGNEGYGIRPDNCHDFTIEDCQVHACGYHGIGPAGGYSGNVGGYNGTVRRCLVNTITGDEFATKTLNGVVFFQHSAPTQWGGNVGDRTLVICAPQFKDDGTPTVTGFSATPYLSHATTGSSYTGVLWKDCVGIDFADEVATKTGVANSAIGCFATHANYPTATPTDPTTYAVRVVRCIGIGRMALQRNSPIFYDRYLLDRSGAGTTAVAFHSGTGVSNTVYLKDCTILTGLYPGASVGFFDNFAVDDFLILYGRRTRVLIETTVAKSALFTQAADDATVDNVLLLGGDYDSNGAATHAIARAANATIYNNNVRSVQSGGINRFGASLEGFLYHSNTGAVPTPQSFAWEQANITGASTDQSGLDLGWGTTATAKRDYLRDQWYRENPISYRATLGANRKAAR